MSVEGANTASPQIVQRAEDRGDEMRPHVRLQAVDQIDAPRGRHAIVDQDDVRRVQQRFLEGAFGVGHGADVDALAAQKADQRAHDRAARRNDETLDLSRSRQLFMGSPLVGEHSVCRA